MHENFKLVNCFYLDHGKQRTDINKTRLLSWVNESADYKFTNIPRTIGHVERNQTADKVNGQLNSIHFQLTTRLQTWSSETTWHADKHQFHRQLQNKLTNHQCCDLGQKNWLRNSSDRKMFQTSDTPTVSFKSQFRSEEVRITTSTEAFMKRHVVLSNVTRFAGIVHMTKS